MRGIAPRCTTAGSGRRSPGILSDEPGAGYRRHLRTGQSGTRECDRRGWDREIETNGNFWRESVSITRNDDSDRTIHYSDTGGTFGKYWIVAGRSA